MTWHEYRVRLIDGTQRTVRSVSIADALWRASNRHGIAAERIAGIEHCRYGEATVYETRESIMARTGRP